MQKSDFDDFNGLLTDCLAMWGVAPTAKQSAMWFACLSAYGIDDVRAALIAHMRDPAGGKFEPKPAHIIEQLERAAKSDGRPGVEEAWAISIAAKNESDTVIWTRECLQAWAIAKPILDCRDEVGARMAFKEAYTRLVSEARKRREPVAWEASIGFDKDKRREAVNNAVEAGRIPPGVRIEYQPADMLMLERSTAMPDYVREKLKELRNKFSAPKVPAGNDALEKTKALKKAQADRVKNYQAARKHSGDL